MVLINEWLPNPVGSDAAGEWLELWNGGPAQSLSGWQLADKSGKRFTLGSDARVGSDGFLVLPRAETKLTLRNSDERLSLYDAQGRLADTAVFPGAAPEGKSVSRLGDLFLLTEPTPGAANASPAELAESAYVAGQILNPGPVWLSVSGLTLLLGAALAAISFFIFKQTHDAP